MLVSSYVIWKAVGVLKTRTFEELDLLALTSSEITITTLRDLALQLHEITANEKIRGLSLEWLDRRGRVEGKGPCQDQSWSGTAALTPHSGHGLA